MQREILELKQNCKSNKLEIDEINSKITHLTILCEQLAKSAQKMEYFDDHKTKQICHNDKSDETNQYILKAIEHIDKAIARIEEVLSTKCSDEHANANIIGINDKIQKLNAHYVEDARNFERKLSMAEVGFRDRLSVQKNEIESSIMKKADEAIVEVKALIIEAKKSIEDAKYAKEVAERIGVEIKVLNRKLNEVLAGMKS